MLGTIIHPLSRFIFLSTLLAIITVTVLDTQGVKARVSNVVFEQYIKWKPRAPSGQLIFVDIDDQSLSKVGQWPWPRTKIAQIITNLKDSGAKVIIFDGVLAEPDRTSAENIAALLPDDHPARAALKQYPKNDRVLAQAIKDSGIFVAGFSHGSNPKPPITKRRILVKKDVKNYLMAQNGRGSLHFKTTAQFLPELQAAAAGNGSFMASAENDAVIRRTGLIFHNDKTLYPSLIFEGMRVFADKRGSIKFSANPDFSNAKITEPFTAQIGTYNVPVGSDGKMWVHFRHFTKDENISAYRFLDEDYKSNPPDVTDKIIFIASSAEGLMDLRATPLGMQPGVRVHMNALEQILQNQYLIRPHTANILEIGGAVIISVLVIILAFFVNPIWLLGIVTALSVGAFWLAWYLFVQFGGLFDALTPSFMVAIIFVFSAMLSYLKTEFEKKQVRSAFGMYVSRDVMRDLEKNPDKLKLGGENKDLTIMFTDIRKFTTISEGLTPEELIHLMNDFLTAMTDIVMEHGGTIDKYMGDAMMAFWNAPKDVAGHEREACIAALKMQSALEPINQRVIEKAKELGKDPVTLQAGIGINTGACAVGNMGSHQRFAYSALGDAVNLASRLEGQTKAYGVATLIGEDTLKHVPDMATLEMDFIRVKGKTKPVRIYALLGDDKISNTQAFVNLKTCHENMIKAYQSADFKTAQNLLKECKKLKNYNLSETYRMYQNRIAELLKNPPDNKWDGVFEATSK